ncbi:MAG: hypothetical protein H0V95_06770, partial [Actinobacteria bacterium]|nr:hypothetical protein [Actinomycetota bacterium]
MASPRPTLTTADVLRFVDDRSFTPTSGPDGHVGVEVEWLPVDLTDPFRPVPEELVPTPGTEPGPAGSRLTLEPGGQIELSSPPLRGIGPACA